MTDSPSSHLSFLARTGFLALVGRTYYLFISLLSGILVARVMGAADYGLFSLSRSLCETVLVFVKGGYDLALVRYIPEAVASGNREKALWFARMTIVAVTVLGMIPVVLLVIGGGAWLERDVYRYQGFQWVILAMSLLIPFAAVLQVLGGAFSGFMVLIPRTIVEFILQPTVRLLIILGLFTLDWRLWATVIGTVVSYFIGSIVLVLISAKTIFKGVTQQTIPKTSAIRELSAVGKYSIVLALSGSIALLLQRLDTLMLGFYVDAGQVGSYAVVQMILSILTIANASLGQSLGPLVSNLYRCGDTREMMLVMQHHARWIIMLTLPLAIVLAAVGDRLIPLFGQDYVVVSGVVIMLACAQTLSAVMSSCGYALSMTGRHKQEFWLMMIGLVANVTLNLVFIPGFGMSGAALSTLLAIVIANVLRVCFVFRLYRMSPIGMNVLRPIVIAIATFSPIYFVLSKFSDPPSLITISGFMMAYLALYIAGIALAGLTREDRELGARALIRLGIG